jgi:hypothetical protein
LGTVWFRKKEYGPINCWITRQELVSWPARPPPLWTLPLFDVVLDNTGSAIRALANLMTVEMFESGTDRAVDIVILARESILAGIT